MDWFLYDIGLRHERVKIYEALQNKIYLNPLMPGGNKEVAHT